MDIGVRGWNRRRPQPRVLLPLKSDRDSIVSFLFLLENYTKKLQEIPRIEKHTLRRSGFLQKLEVQCVPSIKKIN